MRQSIPNVFMRRTTASAAAASPIRPAGGFPRRATTPPQSPENDEPVYAGTWRQDEIRRKAEMDRQREQQEAEKMRRRAAEHTRRLEQQKAQRQQEAERRRAEIEVARLRAEEARIREGGEAARQRRKEQEAAAAAAAASDSRRLQEQLQQEQRRRAAEEARIQELQRQRREREEQEREQRAAQEREQELRKRRQPASRPTSPYTFLPMKEAWEVYERRWHSAVAEDAGNAALLTFESIPWPMNPQPTSVHELDGALVKSFILSPAHSLGKPAKQRLREQLLRFHPDRFLGRWLSRVGENDRAAVKEGVNKVARYINEALAQHSSL